MQPLLPLFDLGTTRRRDLLSDRQGGYHFANGTLGRPGQGPSGGSLDVCVDVSEQALTSPVDTSIVGVSPLVGLQVVRY